MLSIEDMIQLAKYCGVEIYYKDDVKPKYFNHIDGHALKVGYTKNGRIIVREIDENYLNSVFTM